MDISVKTSEVKDTKDEASVMDNSVIKSPGYFQLFACGKEFFNNLDATYGCVSMASAKENHWSEFHQIITN